MIDEDLNEADGLLPREHRAVVEFDQQVAADGGRFLDLPFEDRGALSRAVARIG